MLISAISFGVLAKPGFVNSGQETYLNGGFRGPTPALTSIEQAKSLHDDAWVVLVGHVIKQVGHELYEFRGRSGSTYVEIDDKYWMARLFLLKKSTY
ncbi:MULTISPECIES: NirD/YgiW/YdeI family stress tolerance protein [Pantoea]|uniref:NirD/YgiW/YdeI family stress tolerance protein n=1 Tax=Pantoea TaxID=53335 RepID=UPI00197E0EB1|nr:NirD/YgiW/YdeI family stress tolerance protein [Pantoea sp. JZ2]